MKNIALLFVVIALAADASAQSIGELQANYSGRTAWDSGDGRFTFLSSGAINFRRDKEMSGIWTIPAEVKTISIAAGTRVTGQFTIEHDCTVEGKSDTTSILYGTDIPCLLHDRGMDQGGRCMPYSTVFGKGKIDVRVKNLTVLNPVAYMFTGAQGARIHLDHVRGIDNRGGWHNHSDGIQGAKGSTIRDCYFECGDDVIKVYGDLLVENTTIKMIQNCVPIQLGWGSYGDGARGVFRNVTIIGDHGRSKVPPVIEGTAGQYRKTIEIDGLVVANPKATLVRLREEGMELDLTIRNANIAVAQFSHDSHGICRSVINGSKEQANFYKAAGRN